MTTRSLRLDVITLIAAVTFNTFSSIAFWNNRAKLTYESCNELSQIKDELFTFQQNRSDDLQADFIEFMEEISDKIAQIEVKMKPLFETRHESFKKKDTFFTSQPMPTFTNVLKENSNDVAPAKTGENLSLSNAFPTINGYSVQLQSLEDHNVLRRELLTSVFIEDDISNRVCDQLPILSATNHLSNFHFDERVNKIINLIRGLTSTESLDNRSSPQYKAACWMLYDDERNFSSEDALFVERYVLAVFLYAISHNEGLMLSFDTCDYDVVSCDESGHIISIDVKGQGISSSIPSELAYLRSLEKLILSENFFVGTIPEELGRLSSLRELDLGHNDFYGVIPSDFRRLLNLETLCLNSNHLIGSVPSIIDKLSQLQRLELNDNELTGSIPQEIFECSQLRVLLLNTNHLTGSIPNTIMKLHQLETVDFSNNYLHGQLPIEIGTLLSLKQFWAGSNELSGPIPNEIENLSSLEKLVLNHNFLNGTLPDVFEGLPSLRIVNLCWNELSGSIPSSLLAGHVNETIMLDENDFNGSIPPNFCSILSHFHVDESSWFLDEPKVECSCCKDISCNVWNTDDSRVRGTVRTPCPSRNIVDFEFYEKYWIEDHTINAKVYDYLGLDISQGRRMCLSPTGCYSVYSGSEETLKYRLGFSSSSMSLQPIQSHDQCEAVEICGISFGQYHPKRNKLNHLTQLAIPDLSMNDTLKIDTLCWMLNKDVLFDDYAVCDGTLLQRFVLALFFKSQQHVFDFDVFSSHHTCDWPGITCDLGNKFVEKIDFHGKGLTGTLIKEIGLLTRLQVIDVTENALDGTIDPSLFSNLPYLATFLAGGNEIGGEIPQEFFSLPNLQKVNISNNKFIGSFPSNISYSGVLEHVDVGNNLLRGQIPSKLIECHDLQYIDLSRNNLDQTIPSTIGELDKLKVLQLQQNRISGSIPLEIFNSSRIEVLMLQSNHLTGSIPTEVGYLNSVREISMSHNRLKGSIPTEFQNLRNITLLQLHQNFLTGLAPKLDTLRKSGHMNSFIADCGDPSFLLPSALVCPSCTICCNSEDKCQKNRMFTSPVTMGFGVCFFIIPLITLLFIYSLHRLQKRGCLTFGSNERNSISVYNEDSIYCLIFSNDRVAWLIYLSTAAIQAALHGLFLKTTNFHDDDSDWQYTIRCPRNSMKCQDVSSINWYGWLMFLVVTILFLGSDFVDSYLQLRKAIVLSDVRFFIAGLILLTLTMLALYTSFLFNMALAQSSTELIMNAVILLFINDLDEQLLNFLDSAVPFWIAQRYFEIESNLSGSSQSDEVTIKPNSRLASFRFRGVQELSLSNLSVKRPEAAGRLESGMKMLGIISSNTNLEVPNEG